MRCQGTERTLPTSQVLPANPAGMTAPDNAALLHLNEAAVLDNIKSRYGDGQIYTLTGSILVAVNPFQPMPRLYSSGVMAPYQGKRLGMQPPLAPQAGGSWAYPQKRLLATIGPASTITIIAQFLI